MKKYYLALFLVAAIYVASIHYRIGAISFLDGFPVEEFTEKDGAPKVVLILFFSMRNCDPCLRIIETLNRLDGFYKVVGLIPEEELGLIEKLREATDAQFEIRGRKSYKKYFPNYYPTLYAINMRGEIFFALPGVPGENEYFRQFLESFVHRANELLIR